jgi:O-antigen/teichoic acid export membrane protein
MGHEMTSVRLNVIANYISRVWISLLALILVPIYLSFLGVEAYGLIGFYTTLLTLFAVFDLGLGATINREMALLSSRPEKLGQKRDLLRTMELIYIVIAVGIGIVMFLSSDFVVINWLNPVSLTRESVQLSVVLLGIAIAVQWPLGLYRGGLLGLQRQILVCSVDMGAATARGLGAVLILWLISPTIEAFFIWQALVSFAHTMVMGALLWHCVPTDGNPGKFSVSSLESIWKFAAGVMGASVTWVVLSQLDKVLLSALLSLEDYGYYMIAVMVSSVLMTLVGPIYTAMYPRFSELVAAGDEKTLSALYHKACQLVSVVTLPLAAALGFFSFEVLLLWTGNAETAENTALLLSLLLVGTALHGMTNLPYALQLANGWTTLCLYFNLVAIVFLVPALIILVPAYGALGAAGVWLILNVGYVLFDVFIMHRRLLIGEQWRWYLQDVGLPSVAVLGITFSFHNYGSTDLDGTGTVVLLGSTLISSYMVVVLITPKARNLVLELLR